MARPSGRPIKDELVDAAQKLIQDVGVSGFSYADLAKVVEVSKPTIHHHFSRKDDLVAEVLARYCLRFTTAVSEMPAGTARERIRAYAKFFDATVEDGLMCPCGTVATEWSAVGGRSRESVERYFNAQTLWLTAEIKAGVEAGELAPDIDASVIGTAILAALEGAVIINRARTTIDPSLIVSGIIDPLLANP